MQALRCFVAVPIAAQVADGLARVQDELRVAVPRGVRWERPRNFHLTLKFLGDVAVDLVPRVTEVVARAAEAAGLSCARPEGVDAFPNVARPRVLVLRLAEPAGALAAAVRVLEEGFAELGFPREARAFRPHLTLGRVEKDARLGDLGPILHEVRYGDAPSIPVDSLALYQSELSPRGATYTALCEYPLVGDAGDEALA
jgi:RNA 2',3'-cyclic 3'-phosphodiesterase